MATNATESTERPRLLREALTSVQGARDAYAGINPVYSQWATDLCIALESAIRDAEDA